MNLENDIINNIGAAQIVRNKEGEFRLKNGPALTADEIVNAARSLAVHVNNPFRALKVQTVQDGQSRREKDQLISNNRRLIGFCDQAIQIIKSRHGRKSKSTQFLPGYRIESRAIISARKYLSGLQTLNRAALK